MIPVSRRADERTVLGKIANRTILYPDLNLRLRELEWDVRRAASRCQTDADRMVAEEKQERLRFKAAAKRGAPRSELQIHAEVISNIAGRRRMKLKHKKQYMTAVGEIENVRSLKDQTVQMSKLSKICASINIANPMEAVRKIERDYSKSKAQMKDKNEMIQELYEDEDEEYENKEHDADALVDQYLAELNIHVASVTVPVAAPSSRASSSSSSSSSHANNSSADDALLAQIDRL